MLSSSAGSPAHAASRPRLALLRPDRRLCPLDGRAGVPRGLLQVPQEAPEPPSRLRGRGRRPGPEGPGGSRRAHRRRRHRRRLALRVHEGGAAHGVGPEFHPGPPPRLLPRRVPGQHLSPSRRPRRWNYHAVPITAAGGLESA